MLFCISFSVRASEPSSDASTSSDSHSRLFEEIAEEVAELERRSNVLKKVVRFVKPSVVHIQARKTSLVGTTVSTRRSVEEAGSGVIVQLEGQHYVLTNRHVISQSELNQIQIQLSDGRITFPVRVWTDRHSDVAVMGIASRDLVPARLADSDGVEIGDFVLAVGSPFGLSHSVTYGIISAKGRRDLRLGNGDVKYQDFLQTDAAINPGNSGGPLLNLRGEVIGINTAIASSSGGSEGIGFTIPINMFIHIANQLVQSGNVRRAYLGVRLDRRFGPLQANELGLPVARGARVTEVTPNSPAAEALLRIGDVIVQIDDKPIDSDDHLVNLISLLSIDRRIEVTFYRDGKRQSVWARVGARESFERD
ncbi:MAG: PDZ domain-containing protein [Planctomycetaceae bacterium]|nr:MAG: PDZ domain-containing protein [Planctomycetaceae bacterium]